MHLDVFVGIHQVPVDVLDLVDRGDDLKAESDIGDLAVILGDTNKARIRKQAQPLQQRQARIVRPMQVIEQE